MIIYMEPAHPGHAVVFVKGEDAIKVGREVERRFGKGPAPSDDALLADFKVVHLAEDLDVVLNRMAYAMWKMWRHGGKTEVTVSEKWENVNQAGWKDQAKEALRALGVELP